jgi:hypothetical protein
MRPHRQGAFQGQAPPDAYFVRCDPETLDDGLPRSYSPQLYLTLFPLNEFPGEPRENCNRRVWAKMLDAMASGASLKANASCPFGFTRSLSA